MDILHYKTSNCVNCYKCVRHCPVKSIRFTEKEAMIIENACIYCGNCVKVCPKNVKNVAGDLQQVVQWIENKEEVIASVSTAFVAAFDIKGFGAMKEALLQMGFSDAFESAEGAYLAKKGYEMTLKEEHPDVLISSNCPSVNLLIEKKYPLAIKYLSNMITPEEIHAIYLKKNHPHARIVSITSCVALKETDGVRNHTIDALLTFNDIDQYFKKNHITFTESVEDIPKISRSFKKTGGIIRTLHRDSMYTYVSVDGVDECEKVLQDIIAGKLHHVFLEMNACEGGCISGCGLPNNGIGRVNSIVKLNRNSGDAKDVDYDIPKMEMPSAHHKVIPQNDKMPTNEEIKAILESMGRNNPRDFLNCGACGYDTCQEKAIAVYQGKSDIEMCLPFMKAKAESVSKQILSVSPNAVIAVGMDFKVQFFNPAAYQLLNVDVNEDVMGEDIEIYLGLDQFVSVISDGNIMDQISYIPSVGKYVEKRVIFDEKTQMILIIMKDVTQQKEKDEQRKNLKFNTIEITNDIINKQMSIVQEIASLLGETTAETKVALKHLRDVVVEQEED